MRLYHFLFILIACSIPSMSVAQYSVLGTASQNTSDSQCFQLTQENNFSMGAVWSELPLDLSQSFEIVTDVSFGCISSPENGGDGIAFVLQNQGNIEPTVIGGGLGYDGISPSLAVQFDTYRDNPVDYPGVSDPGGGPFSLPYYDHVGLMKNGSISHGTSDDLGTVPFSPFFLDVEDCTTYSNQQITISWNTTSSTFQVIYCNIDLGTGNPGTYTVVNQVIDISSEIFSGETLINWGFTASTGGAYNEQEVCIRYFDQRPMLADTSICINENLILDYSSLSNFSFSWMDEFGVEFSTSSTLNVSPTTNTTYNLALTNTCSGQTFNESFDVAVFSPTLEEDISQHLDVDCFGQSTGQLGLDYIDGIGTINYSLDLGTEQNSPIFSNLAASNYLVTATDENGCSDNVFIEILEENEMILNIDNIVGVVCNTTASGSVEVTPSGGVGLIDVNWLDENNIAYSGEDIFNLIDGDYFYTLTDDNNCVVNGLVTVDQLNGIDININNEIDVECFEAFTGLIDLTAFGGLFPYEYNWEGPNSFSSNNSTITNIESGTYTLNVVDDEDCYKEFSFDIEQGDEIVLVASSTDASCFNVADGSIELIHLGGSGVTSPFLLNEFSNIISTANTTSSILPGDYTAYATDPLGCQSDIANVTISSPSIAQAIVDNITIPSCFNENDGSINISLIGGTPPYSNFVWSGPDAYSNNIQNITQLVKGNYIFNFTDDNNCIYNQTFFVDEPDNITLNATNIGYVKCTGTNTGSISISTNGGTLPFSSFNWTSSNGFNETSMNIADLFQGQYNITATDANGCTVDSIFTVFEPDSILQVSIITTESCIIENIGTSELDISGGVPPYNVNWLGNDPTLLSAGLNTVQVSDAADCIVTQDFNIDTFPQPIASFNIDTLIKSGVTYLIDNYSTGAQDYLWTFENLGFSDKKHPYLNYEDEGEYIIMLKSMNLYGCSDTISRRTNVKDGIYLFIPDAFSPNGDNLNDDYTTSAERYSTFKMEIFTRNGQLIFTSDDPKIGWDGTFKNTPVQLETYVVRITAYDLFGKIYIKNQELTLLK